MVCVFFFFWGGGGMYLTLKKKTNILGVGEELCVGIEGDAVILHRV